MQSLPDIVPERRAEAARRYLAREIARTAPTEQLSAAESEDISARVLTVLDHPRFAALFAPGSRAGRKTRGLDTLES